MLYPVPEIIIGHDPGSSCWFRPAKCHSKKLIEHTDIELSDSELSIDIDVVEDLLAYFLLKYYDKDLIYNNQQIESGTYRYEKICRKAEFDWFLEHNFYTKFAVRNMLNEISETADALAVFEKSRIPAAFLNSKCAYFTDIESAETAVVFYRNFVSLMTDMLTDNPEWPLLSVMGP